MDPSRRVPDPTAPPSESPDPEPRRPSAAEGWAAVLAKEPFIRAFFEESSVGLNLCRLDGRWLMSNPAFLRTIGYEAAEADDGQLTYWQLTPRKFDADESRQLAMLAQTGRYGPYEKEFVRKDGTLVPVRLNGFLTEVAGERMIWSFIEDISAERDLEAVRARAIQSSKLSALGEMAAAIAHEINNPLSIVAGFAFTLREAIAAGDTDLVKEALDEIDTAVTRVAAITSGLRHLSRGTATDAFSEVDVAAVTQEAALLTGARTRAEGLALALEVATEARVRGNAVQLGQVLINLLNNAVDAVRDAPVREVRLVARDEGASVVLWVEDTGPGVPEALRGRLFDRFFTTKAPHAGTGLGLALSRELVAAMGGTVDYRRDGDRSRFTVTLPRLGGAG